MVLVIDPQAIQSEPAHFNAEEDTDNSVDEAGEDEEEEDDDIEYHATQFARWLVTRSALAEPMLEEGEEDEHKTMQDTLARLDVTLTKIDKTLEKLYRQIKAH